MAQFINSGELVWGFMVVVLAGRILSDLGVLLIGILLFPPALRYRTHRNLVKLENYIDNALPL
jgi:hypothetical protein